jgi:hypothetical protein
MLCSCWLVYGRATGDRLKRRRHFDPSRGAVRSA